jgi:hypothetical protein
MVRLRVNLEGAETPVWRVIEVGGHLTLADLHAIIQRAMGWTDSHLHAFSEHGPYGHEPGSPRRWETKDLAVEPDDEADDEAETLVGEVLNQRARRLFYEYDFGDRWIHRLEWIAQSPRGPGDAGLARVLDGAGRCPLEDSGGVGGWAALARVIADRHSPEREQMLFWAADGIGHDGLLDVASFDLKTANRAVHDLSVLARRFRGIEGGAVKATALDELLMRLPLPVAMRFADRAGLPVDFLADPGAPDWGRVDPESAAATLRPLIWLLERIGPRGLTLTQAGWLPPNLLDEALDAFDLDRRWLPRRLSESRLPPLAQLRRLAEELGLIRKSRGRLSLTKSALAAVADPVALWELVALRLGTRKFGPAQHDAVILAAVGAAFMDERPTDEFWMDMADALTALGWVAGNSFGVSPGIAADLAQPAITLFERTGALQPFSSGVPFGDRAGAPARVPASAHAGAWKHVFVAQPGLRELARSVLAAPAPAARPEM